MFIKCISQGTEKEITTEKEENLEFALLTSEHFSGKIKIIIRTLMIQMLLNVSEKLLPFVNFYFK